MRLTILHLLILCCYVMGSSQTSGSVIGEEDKQEIAKQIRQSLWSADVSKYLLEIPAQYRDQGAVILQRTENKEFYRTSRNYLKTVNLEHRVVKILDKQGLQSFSLFSYESIESEYAYDLTALRVIKPDGEIIVYSTDSLSILKKYNAVTYREFIIPNLQIGDIIDYYYFLDFRVLFPQQYSRIFEPVYWLAQEQYPILSADFQFVLGPSAFINASTTALPDFKQVNYKVDRKTFSKFSLHLDELHALPDNLPWHYPFRDNPNVKYQVFITPYSGNSDIRFNLGGSLKLNQDIQLSRLQDFMAYSMQPGKNDKAYYVRFSKYLKARGVKAKYADEVELVKHWQQFLYLDYNLVAMKKNATFRDHWQFVTMSSGLLKRFGIQHEVVIGLDRALSTNESFILSDEIIPFIRIPGVKEIYVEPPSERIQPLNIASRFENQSLYTYNPMSRRLHIIDIQGAVHSTNRQKINYIYMPDPEQQTIAVEYSNDATGHEVSEIRADWLTPAIMMDRYVSTEAGAWLIQLTPKKKAAQRTRSEIEKFSSYEKSRLFAERKANIERASGRIIESYSSDLSIDFDAYSEQPAGVHVKANYLLSDPKQTSVSNLMTLDLTDLHDLAWTETALADTREGNLYFSHPFEREVTISIIIPAGYAAPDLSALNTTEHYDFGKLEISTNQSDVEILLNIRYTMEQYTVSNEQYSAFKSINDKIDAVLNYKILLRKDK